MINRVLEGIREHRGTLIAIIHQWLYAEQKNCLNKILTSLIKIGYSVVLCTMGPIPIMHESPDIARKSGSIT